MNHPFQFRQFQVFHDQSSMKIGTDATLLGAIANPNGSKKILDIGTGCGVISLMLAQKTIATIDAIDIDKASADEATLNFQNSPWANRLHAKHASLQHYASHGPHDYDTIVANPPFFSRSLKNRDSSKAMARHNDSLPFSYLLETGYKLSSEKANMWLILPEVNHQDLLSLTLDLGWNIHAVLNIHPKPDKPANRVVYHLRKCETKGFHIRRLIIRQLDGSYTTDYNHLLKDYLLHL